MRDESGYYVPLSCHCLALSLVLMSSFTSLVSGSLWSRKALYAPSFAPFFLPRFAALHIVGLRRYRHTYVQKPLRNQARRKLGRKWLARHRKGTGGVVSV
jgi:hypothetical protein